MFIKISWYFSVVLVIWSSPASALRFFIFEKNKIRVSRTLFWSEILNKTIGFHQKPNSFVGMFSTESHRKYFWTFKKMFIMRAFFLFSTFFIFCIFNKKREFQQNQDADGIFQLSLFGWSFYSQNAPSISVWPEVGRINWQFLMFSLTKHFKSSEFQLFFDTRPRMNWKLIDFL